MHQSMHPLVPGKSFHHLSLANTPVTQYLTRISSQECTQDSPICFLTKFGVFLDFQIHRADWLSLQGKYHPETRYERPICLQHTLLIYSSSDVQLQLEIGKCYCLSCKSDLTRNLSTKITLYPSCTFKRLLS